LPANNDLATGTAELYTTLAPSIILTNPAALAGGAFQFSFTYTPGAALTVFSATNLGLPFTNWPARCAANPFSKSAVGFMCPENYRVCTSDKSEYRALAMRSWSSICKGALSTRRVDRE